MKCLYFVLLAACCSAGQTLIGDETVEGKVTRIIDGDSILVTDSKSVEYEVQFRESLGQAAVVAPFSISPDGPFDRTVFSAPTNQKPSLFVERVSETGFYTVAVLTAEI